MRGSCTKASSMAMTLSLLARSTRMVSSQLDRKLPSMPDTSIALIIIRVSLNGTCTMRHGALRQCPGTHSPSTCRPLASAAQCSTHIAEAELSTHEADWLASQNRRHTFSGNFSRVMLASKQSPKSMWRSLPE